jgi:hypothetical protein
MPRDRWLDLHCAPCHRADGGDLERLHLAPRLARFALRADGAFGAKVTTRDGQLSMSRPPEPHVRPDGGITWYLRCPQGHFRQVQEERIIAALRTLPPGAARRRAL